MPPRGRKKVNRSGKQSLVARCFTTSITEFQRMQDYFPGRPNIISEGDSWFAYPPKWLVNNAPANLIEQIKLGPWMKRFMDQAGIGIPRNLQRPVAKIFMDELAAVQPKIGASRKNFVMVDTLGTLKKQESWTDEIHPTKDGFAALAGVIWWKMVAAYPQLRG